MSIFKKTIKYSKPSKNLDTKIQNIDEQLKRTGVTVSKSDKNFLFENNEKREEVEKIDWRKDIFDEKDPSEILNEEIALVKENIENKTKVLKTVDNHIENINEDFSKLKKEIFEDISKNFLFNIPIIEKKLDIVFQTYDQLREGLLREPPETKNQDPLTPLDKNFVTIDDLNRHYTLFINRVQEQLSTVGGGGETQLRYLDDIVGIATNPSIYDGKYLRYNHSSKKFVFETAGGGEQGVQGIQGIQGLQGVGSQGTQGIPGESGIQGPAGTSQGSQGTYGDQGIQGIQGLSNQGVQGLSNQGTQGLGGDQGTQGIVGDQGAQGIQGLDGLYAGQGTQGIQGLGGDQGAQGTQGLNGDQGTQGIQGLKGDQGAQGTQGLNGDQGVQGIQGLSGDQGAQGTQGLNGDQGIQGTQGIPGEYAGQGTQGTLGQQGSQGVQGIGDQGTQGTFGQQGSQGVQGIGDQGAQGLSNQGIQGLSGDQGAQGTQGLNGNQGAQGIQGLSNQGAQGLNGNQGAQGIQGLSNQGVQGLSNQGTQGLNGNQGAQGTQGLNGNQGSQGVQGLQGILGLQGAQGTQGLSNQGVQGIQGTTSSFGSRTVVSGTTGPIGAASTSNLDIVGYKSYGLLKVGITSAAWVVIYSDSTSRANDSVRSYLTDPTPGSGIIAEVRTTNPGISTFLITPGIVGWNNDVSVGSTIYAKVTNNESSSASITVNLTIVQLET